MIPAQVVSFTATTPISFCCKFVKIPLATMEGRFVKRILFTVLLLTLPLPASASTHKDTYSKVRCSQLWAAVKDTLKNSGKYGIISIDSEEMTASYNIGGNLTGKRINSAMLNSKDDGASCELQVQTA